MENRRDFLKKSGLAIAGISLPFPTLSCTSQNKKLGVALVGLGYYSTDILAPALQLTKHYELRGIVTGSSSKIPVWQERYGIKDANVYNYNNLESISNNSDIDILYIVTLNIF